MVFDHQAFFIEKREVNDKKIERWRSLKQLLSFIRTTMFSKYRNQPFFKKKKERRDTSGVKH